MRKLCSMCKCERPRREFGSRGRTYRTCDDCRERARRTRAKLRRELETLRVKVARQRALT